MLKNSFDPVIAGKTSAGGIAMILTALTQIINGYRDTGSISISAEAIGLISGGLALLFARDNNVSSEAAGVHQHKEDDKA